MKTAIDVKDQASYYDIVICGGGIAGLWLLNILKQAGYNVILVEPKALGGIQTIASQGMIHGGQKYMLGSKTLAHAENVSKLPYRWDRCLSGNGEINLSDVRILSDMQVMWPAGGGLSHLALGTAALMVQAKVRKLSRCESPKALSSISNSAIYELPEKVLDISSLVDVLVTPNKNQIYMATVDSLSRSGYITVSGNILKAQIIICAAGLGNEQFLNLLDSNNKHSQRRPLRQIMVKTMEHPLFGHGITTDHKPRITVTSHPLLSGGYLWYLGGSLAEDTASLSNDESIEYAKREMKDIFPDYQWVGKEWSTWFGFRAEPYCKNNRLPNSPVVQEYGDVLVVWPSKLTLAPILGDQILSLLSDRGIMPKYSHSHTHIKVSAHLPPYAIFPWCDITWSN